MARKNPVWGEERIASELLVKLCIQISPRTVRKYMPKPQPRQSRGDQRWSTFLKNHANAIVVYDFVVAATATFRMLYVFVVIEHGSRRLVRVDVTAHPSAEWTLPLFDSRPGQHFREGPGRVDQVARSQRTEIATARPEGDLYLRKGNGNATPRMPRLANSNV